MDNKVQNLNILYNKTIKVVGVTFGCHPKNINTIINNGIEYKIFKRYKGNKDKQIIKNNKDIQEFNYEELGDVILKEYTFNGEEAIKVYINDFDDEYLEIGSIPKKEVNKLLPYIHDKNILIDAYLTGGNIKNIKHDKKRDYLDIKENNIGISLDIIVKEHKSKN